MQVLCANGTRKSKPRVDYAKSNIQWHFFTLTIDTRNSCLANAKIHMSLYKFLLCLILNLNAISKYRPQGLIFEGWFNRGFFALRVWGLILGISEFYGNYHNEFFILMIYVRIISSKYIFINYNDEADEKRYSPTLTPFSISPGEGRLVWATAVVPLPFRLVIDHSRKYHNIP